MGGSSYDHHVVCPFYLYDKAQSIYCESPLTGATNMSSFFEKKCDKNINKKRYCMRMDGYKDCPIAKALLQKFSE